jgi:CBS domain-containing protein
MWHVMVDQTGSQAPLLVEDAVEPVSHRVGPDTPLEDVVDVIVRRRVGAVPVVGESSEVLGIITSGDALDEMIRGRAMKDGGSGGKDLTARDVMTRTVLCVSEGQPLIEAAHMMVHKRVEQLPVVREGKLIGMITRSRVLRALHLGTLTMDNEGEVAS